MNVEFPPIFYATLRDHFNRTTGKEIHRNVEWSRSAENLLDIFGVETGLMTKEKGIYGYNEFALTSSGIDLLRLLDV